MTEVSEVMRHSLKAEGLIRPQAGVEPLYIDRFRFCHNPGGVTEREVGLSPLRGFDARHSELPKVK
ncbi:MAG: hypothetical protein IKN75_00315 [Prevotella sp.]|nr:hypothetical protein [Prevotella sp.]